MTGLFITARLGSTRLKRKHLLEVNGRPILYYLLKRIMLEFRQDLKDQSVKLVIVSSDEEENRRFESFREEGADIFYGSRDNIPLRHLQAAKALGVEKIVSIDGDDILCSVHGMRKVYDALNQGNNYVKTSDLPLGMNSLGYSKKFLEEALRNYSDKTLETGWGRIFDESQMTAIAIPFKNANPLLRFTLDYEEDFRFFKEILIAFGDRIFTATDEEIVDLVENKELYRITASISQQYWENFNKNIAKEGEQIGT